MTIYVEEVIGGYVEIPDDVGLDEEDIYEYLDKKGLWPTCDDFIDGHITSVELNGKEHFYD